MLSHAEQAMIPILGIKAGDGIYPEAAIYF